MLTTPGPEYLIYILDKYRIVRNADSSTSHPRIKLECHFIDCQVLVSASLDGETNLFGFSIEFERQSQRPGSLPHKPIITVITLVPQASSV
jgi:hypothetical protein